LMSATRTGFNDGAFCFEQKVPIPVWFLTIFIASIIIIIMLIIDFV
jgi:hypothetical protein